jgi:hypothetical protein
VVRIFEVKEFSQRKKLLLLQSEIHRQTLRVQIAGAQESFAHLQKRFAILGISSVALSVGASVAGLFMAKKSAPEGGVGSKGGILAKVMSGVSVFNQVKSVFKKMRGHSEENPE